MLIDELKKRMFAAIKAQNTVEKEILRTAIGEITRTGEEATDERVVTALRKMCKSCQETLGLTTDEAQRQIVQQEIAILEDMLPKGPKLDDLLAALAPIRDQVRAAGNDGQATGLVVKHLKGLGLTVGGKEASDAARALRA